MYLGILGDYKNIIIRIKTGTLFCTWTLLISKVHSSRQTWFFWTGFTHLLALRAPVCLIDQSQSSMAVRSSGWGQYTIPTASVVPSSWLKPWAAALWSNTERSDLYLTLNTCGDNCAQDHKQLAHLLGTSMLIMQVSRSSPCWSVHDTRIQRWSCDRQYPTKSTLYLGGISAHISPCSGCLGRVGPRMKGGEYSCSGLGCWRRKQMWVNMDMYKLLKNKSNFDLSCLPLDSLVQN